MITTAAVVAIITSLGWLVLNWSAFRSSAAEQGWSGATQLQIALIWVLIFATMTLIVSYFGS